MAGSDENDRLTSGWPARRLRLGCGSSRRRPQSRRLLEARLVGALQAVDDRGRAGLARRRRSGGVPPNRGPRLAAHHAVRRAGILPRLVQGFLKLDDVLAPSLGQPRAASGRPAFRSRSISPRPGSASPPPSSGVRACRQRDRDRASVLREFAARPERSGCRHGPMPRQPARVWQASERMPQRPRNSTKLLPGQYFQRPIVASRRVEACHAHQHGRSSPRGRR